MSNQILKKIPIEIGEFGRIATKKAEETIKQEIIKKKRQMVYEKYLNKVGELINGSVHRFEGRNVWLNLGQAEALLKKRGAYPQREVQTGTKPSSLRL